VTVQRSNRAELRPRDNVYVNNKIKNNQ